MPFHHRDHHGPDDHRAGEKIVELVRVPTRFEADTLVAALESRGIKAGAVHSDASGWAPQYGVWVGHRVMVFENDLDIARTILAEQPAEQASD